jgi:type IV secretory pathway VirB2 component (pilin)
MDLPRTAAAPLQGIASENEDHETFLSFGRCPMIRVMCRARGMVPVTVVLALVLSPMVLFAQSPWERAALNLETTFTGPLARSLALVAIVVGGLMFMFGEGGAKRQISGIVFGGGLALFAGQFLAWLF